MRNITTCDIRLHAATETSAFEKALLADVMPGAGDLPHPPDTLFVRSLYRAAGDGFPPHYRCVVHTTLVSDSGFFRMRAKIGALGADAGEPRFRLLAGALPGDATALEVVAEARTLVALTVHLPLRLIQEAFEGELDLALRGEVGVRTRVNNVDAAFWTRDDSVVPGRTEYLVAALGQFMHPELRGDTLARIRAAGGHVVASHAFHHVGTVAGAATNTQNGSEPW